MTVERSLAGVLLHRYELQCVACRADDMLPALLEKMTPWNKPGIISKVFQRCTSKHGRRKITAMTSLFSENSRCSRSIFFSHNALLMIPLHHHAAHG